jgi:hypothetical protein
MYTCNRKTGNKLFNHTKYVHTTLQILLGFYCYSVHGMIKIFLDSLLDGTIAASQNELLTLGLARGQPAESYYDWKRLQHV